MRVLAVDPGPHVGCASWHNEFDPTGCDPLFQAWEWTPEEVYNGSIEAWIGSVNVVVCEGFRISGARANEANATIEMIGILRHLAREKGRTFVEQSPADAKSFGTAEKLKRIGWWERGGSDHARSATRHLLLYLCEANLIDRRILLPSLVGGGGT